MASKLSCVEDLTAPPVIGQRYLVPTVRHPWHDLVSDWPVMGPKHDDHELRFYQRHYHIDLRFLTVRQARKMASVYRHRSGYTLVADTVALAAARAPVCDGPRMPDLPEPVLRVRRCVEVDHAYPLAFSLQNPPNAEMHRTYAGRRCGRNADGGLICPHKGFALGSLQPDERGRVICPLHGLVIDVNSGVVVEHNGMPEVRHG